MTNDRDVSEPPGKKLKPTEFDLKSFKVDETLNFLTREKVIVVKGQFADSDNDSILIFEKLPFPEEKTNFQNSILNDDYETKNLMSNDIYRTEHITGMSSIDNIKLTVISPATEKHIRKYTKPRFHYVSESPSVFATITKPEVMRNNFSIKWIDNLLNNKAEADRLLIPSEATDNRFVMVMDYKWDGKTMDDLHCLAIVCAGDLHSLRDLTADHLPLLREIGAKCKAAIETKYQIPKSQLRLYFHYPPSFYHLHVHITHIHSDSGGALVDRAHLLSTVIQNIELKSDYYQQATLDVVVNENDSLYELFTSHRCFE